MCKSTVIAFFLLLCIVLIGSHAIENIPLHRSESHEFSHSSLPDYGSACNVTTGCKVNSSLTCDPLLKKCKCSRPKDMVFHANSHQCQTYVEKKCRYPWNETDGSNNLFNVAREETQNCVTGAVCSSAGYCQCKLGYSEYRRKGSVFSSLPEGTRPNHVTCVQSGGAGARCDSQLDCDVTKFLACINNTCTCFRGGDKMEYDATTKTCGIRFGLKCRSDHIRDQLENSSPAIPLFSDKHTAQTRDFYGGERGAWVQILEAYSTAQCLSNTICSRETGLCNCPEGLFIDPVTGNCALKGLDAACSYSQECNSPNLLTCVGGKCDCDPEFAVRNMEAFVVSWRDPIRILNIHKANVSTNICLAKVGVNCSTLKIGMRSDSIYCVQGSECDETEQICKCENGREPMNDRATCGRAYAERCSRTKMCLDRFACKSSIGYSQMTCHCPNTDYEKYDSTTKSEGGGSGLCRKLVGAECTPESVINPCVQNAECIPDPQYDSSSLTIFKCQCKTGFVENGGRQRQCDIAYGQPCGVDSASNSSTLICDKMAGLECRLVADNEVNKAGIQICSCPNLDDVYDPEQRCCFDKRVGGSTGVSDKCGTNNADREKGRRRCGGLSL